MAEVMVDQVCPVCLMPGTKRCANCKQQYYCSRDCQAEHWKTHKRICREVQRQANFKKSLGESEDYKGMKAIEKEMPCLPLSEASVHQTGLPKYHLEYKALYPSERRHFQLLQHARMSSILSSDLGYLAHLDEVVRVEPNDQERWQDSGEELERFLRSNPKPGDIFKEKFNTPYGSIHTPYGIFVHIVYQNMRNVFVPPVKFQLGKTYVGIGYVDMFQLLVGSFEPCLKEDKGKPLKFVGIDKSDLVVARSVILYEMMQECYRPLSILQVWFSTGWGRVTQDDFQRACNSLLRGTSLNAHVRKLLQYWSTKPMTSQDVQPLWSEIVCEGHLRPLDHLAHKKDRVDFARYTFTGHIFVGSDELEYGNVTMFSLPSKEQNYKRDHQGFFAAISWKDFQYVGSLLKSCEKKVSSGLTTLMEHIQKQEIVCEFRLGYVRLGDSATTEEIRKLDAAQIDWSNIPDYQDREEFFTLAGACTGPKTVHTMHFVNWPVLVFGASLLDYRNKTIVYRDARRKISQRYDAVKQNFPFMRQDRFQPYFLVLADIILGLKLFPKFMEYFFEDRQVSLEEPYTEEFHLFQRSNPVFYVSFQFEQDRS